MTKISQTGYSIQEALSELIDNAIDARIPNKKLLVSLDITPDEIVITDNGTGMSEEMAAKSIRLGFSEKKLQLGEFGLGLKTSTSFLGHTFTLITTPLDKDEEYILEYDEDHWLEHGSWYEYPFIIHRNVEKGRSGTTVIIKRLKVDVNEKLVKNIKEEFGTRFAPFIKNDEMELTYNKEICEPLLPEILDNNRSEFEIVFKGGKATGWWGYQLSGLNKNYHGLSTFRRGRLVTTYDKIGLNPNQDIKQIVGEIHIEGIPITHDKKSWLKSSSQYNELESKLREYFKPFEKKPKRILSGYPASSGKVVGVVRLVNMFHQGNMEKEMERVSKGDIVVTAMTRPQFLLAIRRASGIITDLGGNLCHAAIVAREFNIPCVVGTQLATATLVDGQKIILDGQDGSIYEY